MPLPDSLQGSTWSARTARRVLPLLVTRAKQGAPITYGELDRQMVRHGGHHVFAAKYGYPAGAIGDALVETSRTWGTTIPPLNALIVNARTHVPGAGCDWYLREFLRVRRRLSHRDRRDLARATHEKIFNFRRWDDVLREYGMSPTVNGRAHGRRRHVLPPRRSGWSNEGESDAHKRLADFIAKNPDVLGLRRGLPRGLREFPLASADRPDVLFRCKSEVIAVEVKSDISNEADLQRGIYQCVKYRALVRAEQQAIGQIPNGWAVLATARPLPELLCRLAVLFDVPYVVVKE
jgi:hypothetical protein